MAISQARGGALRACALRAGFVGLNMIAHNIIHFQVRPIYHTPPFEGGSRHIKGKSPPMCRWGEKRQFPTGAHKGRPYNESNTSPIYSYSPLLRGEVGTSRAKSPPMCRWGEKCQFPTGAHKGRPYNESNTSPIYHTPPFEGGSRHIKGKSPPMCRWERNTNSPPQEND